MTNYCCTVMSIVMEKQFFSLELGHIYIHLFPWRLYKIVISKYIVYVHKFKIRLQNYLPASLDAFGLYSGFFFKFIYYLTKFYVYKNYFYWIGIKWAYLPDIYVVIMSNNISYFSTNILSNQIQKVSLIERAKYFKRFEQNVPYEYNT